MSGSVDVDNLLPHLKHDMDGCALLLDVDGTLLDLAPTPREVYVSSELRQVLARLRERTKGALAFVSGRGIGELDLIFAPLCLAAVGGHGAEIRTTPSGEVENQAVRPLATAIKQRFAAIAEAGPGIVVEDKSFSIALHYRLAPDHAEYVQRTAAALCEDLSDHGLELLPGKAVVEIKQVGISKATGVRTLMASSPFRGRKPIFIGDDFTDEAVFPIMPEFGGMSFSVGRQLPTVDGCFNSPKDVRNWLLTLAVGTTP